MPNRPRSNFLVRDTLASFPTRQSSHGSYHMALTWALPGPSRAAGTVPRLTEWRAWNRRRDRSTSGPCGDANGRANGSRLAAFDVLSVRIRMPFAAARRSLGRRVGTDPWLSLLRNDHDPVRLRGVRVPPPQLPRGVGWRHRQRLDL